MKRFFIGFFTFLLVGGTMLGIVRAFVEDIRKAHAPKDVVSSYRRLANGTSVYEETPGKANFETIEPAAGANAAQGPRYQYDPLTQTYRVRKNKGDVDSRENTGQDIISDPLHP